MAEKGRDVDETGELPWSSRGEAAKGRKDARLEKGTLGIDVLMHAGVLRW
jgi:hypothetical protein